MFVFLASFSALWWPNIPTCVTHDCKIENFIRYFWMRWEVIRAGVDCFHLWAHRVLTDVTSSDSSIYFMIAVIMWHLVWTLLVINLLTMMRSKQCIMTNLHVYISTMPSLDKLLWHFEVFHGLYSWISQDVCIWEDNKFDINLIWMCENKSWNCQVHLQQSGIIMCDV